MSYEGYSQIICRCGTYFSQPVYNESPCQNCGNNNIETPTDWYNPVDDTNCDSYGYIPTEVIDKHFCIEAEVVETCNLGHQHITKRAKYRVPTKEEASKLRTRYDSEKDKTVLID